MFSPADRAGFFVTLARCRDRFVPASGAQQTTVSARPDQIDRQLGVTRWERRRRKKAERIAYSRTDRSSRPPPRSRARPCTAAEAPGSLRARELTCSQPRRKDQVYNPRAENLDRADSQRCQEHQVSAGGSRRGTRLEVAN